MRYRLGLCLAFVCCTSLATGALALEAARAGEPVQPAPSAPARAATQNTRTAQAVPAQAQDAPVKPVASEQAAAPAQAPPPVDAPGTAPSAAPGGPSAVPGAPSVKPAPIPVAISQDSRPTLDASTFINTMRAASTYLRIGRKVGWPSLPARHGPEGGRQGAAGRNLAPAPHSRRAISAEGRVRTRRSTATSPQPSNDSKPGTDSRRPARSVPEPSRLSTFRPRPATASSPPRRNA